jgi:hypothetical protein
MPAELGLLDLVAGVGIILGIFVAFMIWATFPLLSFALIGAAYAATRYGLPALGRAAVRVEDRAVAGLRRVLTPVAVWTLRGVTPAAVPGTAGRRRR